MLGIQQELNNVFCEVFDRPDIDLKDETTAKDIQGWDSVTHISLAVAIEEQFNVRLSTAEVRRLKNIGEMIQLLEKKTGRSR